MNTRLRLWKEARALLPFWAATTALLAIHWLLSHDDSNYLGYVAYLFGCALLGAASFGHEYQHRTMGLLLAQPVSRRRLWWEKMAVLGAALAGLLACHIFFQHWNSSYPPVTRWHGLRVGHWETPLVVAAQTLLPIVIAFCTGPVLALLARSTIGGVPMALLGPVVIGLIGNVVLHRIGFDMEDSAALVILTLVTFSLYAGGMLLLGCRCFQRWEDRHALAQSVTLPERVMGMLTWLEHRLLPGRGGNLHHLVRKELRLHLATLAITAAILTLWVAFVVAFLCGYEDARNGLLAPAMMLALLVPVIVGTASTAEERHLGVHEWQLTLPVAARRQWAMKVLVALLVNAVLGLLLPLGLAYASALLSSEVRLPDLLSKEGIFFCVANLVLFSGALYASTTATNGLRALIGTVALWTLVAMFIPISERVQIYLESFINHRGAIPLELTYHSWHRFQRFYWPMGWICLAGWVYFIGLANFRTALDSLRLPVRRVSVFLLAAWLFVNIGWHGWGLRILIFQLLGW